AVPRDRRQIAGAYDRLGGGRGVAGSEDHAGLRIYRCRAIQAAQGAAGHDLETLLAVGLNVADVPRVGVEDPVEAALLTGADDGFAIGERVDVGRIGEIEIWRRRVEMEVPVVAGSALVNPDDGAGLGIEGDHGIAGVGGRRAKVV